MDNMIQHSTMKAQVTSGSYLGGGISSETAKKDPTQLASQFEAIFYRMMLKQMRESTHGDPLFDSNQMDTLKGMQHDEMANTLAAAGHLGVKDMMERFISEHTGDHVIPPQDFDKTFSKTRGLLKGA